MTLPPLSWNSHSQQHVLTQLQEATMVNTKTILRCNRCKYVICWWWRTLVERSRYTLLKCSCLIFNLGCWQWVQTEMDPHEEIKSFNNDSFISIRHLFATGFVVVYSMHMSASTAKHICYRKNTVTLLFWSYLFIKTFFIKAKQPFNWHLHLILARRHA